MNPKIILYLLILFITSSIYAQSAVVLMYHRFGEDRYPSTNIGMEQFKFQLDYLEKNSYNVWHLSKIVRYIQDKKTLPPKTVALTIDDAYLSVFTKAYPLLKSKNFPFTVMVNTDQVDKNFSSYMSWNQLRKLKQNGVEFANHSCSHDSFIPIKNETKKDWKKRITNEIQKAQRRINKELGYDVNTNPKLLSYPYGEYNLETAKLAKKLGYVSITQTSGPISIDSDLNLINRFPMSEQLPNNDSFIVKLNSLALPIESATPQEPILQEKNPPILRIKLKQPLKNIACYLSNGDKIDFKYISETELEVQSNNPIKSPRGKYTCTAPAKDGRWYWYSHLWIVND
ncbi:polysaccharide deacetylase family protein [Sulfurimonas lithotrophica]|uniref:Polysaccharide deacetylase family protein n=1 Tax=Sulfurimonas lithotrophica TaxID=2590022 RepID=A0A5P8P208_9BACT|nr:polysaccharide deacetylase family protein [Sulfurimonas lithotrophica]QFR49714.1 polysaccharide deacetylase family protein [Sulfurimonas lithotrophica]